MTTTQRAFAPPDDDGLHELGKSLLAAQRTATGRPRSFAVRDDGRRWCFLRARSDDDERLGLWVMDDGTDMRLIVDPADLGGDDDLDAVERARRERTRERAAGLTAFAVTPDLTLAAFAHGGQLHLVDVDAESWKRLSVAGPVIDPRPSPTGRHVAWVANGAVYVVELASGEVRCIAADDDPSVTWGLAEFVAAEEMGRLRGYWWSPTGDELTIARVDVSQVTQWWLHEPAEPHTTPAALRYPHAGSRNAAVSLARVALDGSRVPVQWDADRWPYLAVVRWDGGGPLTLAVQARDQRELAVLTADDDGSTTAVHVMTAHPWVELVPGTPRWTADGRLVTVEDDPPSDTRRVRVDGTLRSPPGMHIEAVLGALDGDLVVAASTEDPTSTAIHRVALDDDLCTPLSPLDGVHRASASSTVLVIHSSPAGQIAPTTTVLRGGEVIARIPGPDEAPALTPEPRFATLGERHLHSALLLPSWYDDTGDGGSLPVLLDPYGGPHARRVRNTPAAFQTSQWFAEAGFAVLVIDGRGTPGRGLAWEHAVHGDLASYAVEDQIDGLHAAAKRWPQLDIDRVAIRGWSFGGYLAALAVLRRPDAVHAAVAGAPVTEWRLYDTHYTERYLGDPSVDAAAYDASSLLADAAGLRRPLLLLHGMADDNVVAAHTLQLSRALLIAGRHHTVLPLAATTHVTRDLDVEAGLLGIQLRFLRDALTDVSDLRSAQ